MSAVSDDDPFKDSSEQRPQNTGSGPTEAISTIRHADDEDDEDEEEDESEPNLKYSKLTSHLGAVYRNGDSASAVITSGDKLVCGRLILGTHNGNVHVVSLPSMQSIRLYHAHSASILAISVSPYATAFAPAASDEPKKPSSGDPQSPAKHALSRNVSHQSPKAPASTVPSTPANAIYIATASIDGHVCVSSLVDAKDVTLRNFARPVQAVALSPDFKNDRTYLSGGLAGNLILTTGGRQGVSAEANTNSAAAAASGWLGSIGIGSSTGKDTVLHSGEGAISTISWSLTGRYITWVNEQGIKIMRSNLHLTTKETDSAWKRLAHLDLNKPNRRSWEEMAGAWKARIQWVDEKTLESTDSAHDATNGSAMAGPNSPPATPTPKAKDDAASIRSTKPTASSQKHERMLVGWGDTVWMVKIISAFSKPEVLHKFRFDDCIISGLSLYTPSLLIILAYRTRDDNDNPIFNNTSQGTPRRKKANGLRPDLRLIDLESTEEDKTVEVEALHMERFETLSAGDYHVSTTFIKPPSTSRPVQRRAIGSMAGEIWDASLNASYTAGKMLTGTASIRSGGSSSAEQASWSVSHSSTTKSAAKLPSSEHAASPALSHTGLKIFISSPYDCLVAIKRDAGDRLSWLLNHEQYKEAWDLLDAHPEIISVGVQNESRPQTPAVTSQSLVDFFADDRASEKSNKQATNYNLAVEKEKLRIGDLWLQQLISADEWSASGEVAAKVLGTSSTKWEQWIWAFAQANRFDEISPYIPSKPLKPPLPSLVYEVVLGHYINQDIPRMQELLQEWDNGLYDSASVATAIDTKVNSEDVSEKSTEGGIQGRDWRILQNCLAKLHLSDGRPAQALKSYVKVRNADAALEIINEYSLLDSISDEIYDFILLRVSPEQLASPSTSLSDLDNLTSEPIQLLVDAAIQGLISVDTVVSQLESHAPTARPFLFFYFRALWQGSTSITPAGGAEDRTTYNPRRSRFATPGPTAEAASRTLLIPYSDLTITLFAEYSRPLLSDFLKTSTSYSFDHASAECEARHYIPELVHLLSATGQTRKALYLIIDEIGDVAQAIAFAQDMDDPGLWDDLLDYSMDKPAFIRGLLEDVGTSLDPVGLVRRIPKGLEIEGLKGALGKILREVDVQCSISEGAARVLRGEVGRSLEMLRQGQMRGVVFDVEEVRKRETEAPKTDEEGGEVSKDQEEDRPPRPKKTSGGGKCAICETTYTPNPSTIGAEETLHNEHLIGFRCGHIFHLSCLLDEVITESNKDAINKLQQQLTSDAAEGQDSKTRSFQPRGRVGDKVAHAQMISGVLGNIECNVCNKGKVVDDDKG